MVDALCWPAGWSGWGELAGTTGLTLEGDLCFLQRNPMPLTWAGQLHSQTSPAIRPGMEALARAVGTSLSEASVVQPYRGDNATSTRTSVQNLSLKNWP